MNVGVAAADCAKRDSATLPDVPAERVDPLADAGQLQMNSQLQRQTTIVSSTLELVAVSAAESSSVTKVSNIQMHIRAEADSLDCGITSVTLLTGHVKDGGSTAEVITAGKRELSDAGNFCALDSEKQFAVETAEFGGNAVSCKIADRRKCQQDIVLGEQFCAENAFLSQDDGVECNAQSKQAAAIHMKIPLNSNKNVVPENSRFRSVRSPRRKWQVYSRFYLKSVCR